MKVLVWTSGKPGDGSFHYRVNAPLVEAQYQGLLDWKYQQVLSSSDLVGVDIVVAHRLTQPVALGAWEQIAEAGEQLLVVEHDDDMVNVRKDNPLFTKHGELVWEYFRDDCIPAIKRSLEIADLITVTVPHLAEQYRQYTARIAARSAVVGKKADATMVMLRLVRVMQKLNQNVTIAFKRPDASLPWFRGDEGDLEEMAGNLLDNACKWSKGQIAVTMAAERTQNAQVLVIRVEDDGPGLSEEEAQKALRRGVRLDEKTPGSGLGLDIVKELVDVYGGSLQLKRSVLGGLLCELRLPAAKVGLVRN